MGVFAKNLTGHAFSGASFNGRAVKRTARRFSSYISRFGSETFARKICRLTLSSLAFFNGRLERVLLVVESRYGETITRISVSLSFDQESSILKAALLDDTLTVHSTSFSFSSLPLSFSSFCTCIKNASLYRVCLKTLVSRTRSC